VLAELASAVYSVERYAELAESAGVMLDRLGYRNVFIRIGDGTEGLADLAPFDRIVVSAAAPRVPEPLGAQLLEGGRMVIPVGPLNGQELQLVRKEQGQLISTYLGNCVFVPLVGHYAY
jgi:protein-L-isoaspartate(D-aspartate) O-methyltransferase